MTSATDMKLADILTPECVHLPLAASDKQGVIHELIEVLARAGRVSDADSLKDAVWTREQTRTTGIGHGLAIPHGRSAGVSSIAMAVGKPVEPLDFDAIDNLPVRLVVLLASPPDRTSEHIQALARVSRLMTMDEFRARIYEAQTADEIYRLLTSHDA